MRLQSLTVHNFGVFRGRHHFDFKPVPTTRGKRRHLIVVSGQNGVGKSTLFQALYLALHGSLSLSDRTSRADYNDYLLSRLHRYVGTGVPVVSRDGGVALHFEYVQSGRPLRMVVKRAWHRSGSNVNETLTVLCDGKPLELNPADYQAWLNEFVPPGLAPLCFFDAERLETLASVEQQGGLMGDALRRLLGLNLVERLQADLERYTFTQGGGRKAVERLREEALKHQAALDECERQLEQLEAQANNLADEASRIGSELTVQENRLAAEGHSYAARRPVLQERLSQIVVEMEKVGKEVEHLSGELLPFCLIPELCQQIGRRLLHEAKIHLRRTAEGLWLERVASFRTVLEQNEIWVSLRLSAKSRETLIDRLMRGLEMTAGGDAGEEQKLIHNLAEPEQDRLHEWISQTFHTVPQQIMRLGDELRSLQAEQRQIEAELQKAPDDDVLAPIHAEIIRLQETLKELRKQQAVLNASMGALQYQRDERLRHLQRVDEQLRKAQEGERRLALAENSKLALQAYKDALTRQRIAALEEKFLKSFNAICRKEHLLSGVAIAPDDFSVELRGADGEALSVADLSAGERQLYALAWLWALRQVSGRQLPLAIDTPLARLDETHRARFIHDYVPAVSNQVLLFATDAELDTELLSQAEPYIARLYQLKYDQESKETNVGCSGYSKPKDVVLYRAAGAKSGNGNGTDYFCGVGQIWLHKAEQVGSDEKRIKQAILPATAKRLILADPDGDAYNWAHIAELSKLVKDKYLLNALRNGQQIYDLWQEDWAQLLKQAGYDSIATVNIEGTVEHVLDVSKLQPVNGSKNGKKA